jgi:hypothetical protein
VTARIANLRNASATLDDEGHACERACEEFKVGRFFFVREEVGGASADEPVATLFRSPGCERANGRGIY